MGLSGSESTQPATEYNGMRTSESILGTTLPILIGQQRLSWKLLWYGAFNSQKAKQQGGSGAGKGGVEYVYSASVIGSVCMGDCANFLGVWDSTGRFAVEYVYDTVTLPNVSPAFTPSTAFKLDLGVAINTSYSVVANDFGSPTSVTKSGSQLIPLTYTTSSSPGPGQYTINAQPILGGGPGGGGGGSGGSVSLPITSVNNASGGNTVYNGTITDGASNAYINFTFSIKGSNFPQNNGQFTCTGSSLTTLTLNNPSGVADTAVMEAIIIQGAPVYVFNPSQAGAEVIVNYTANRYQIIEEEIDVVPTVGPYNVVVQYAATFEGDLGVKYYPSGIALEEGTGTLSAGQYKPNNGTYEFSSADAGAGITISYTWNNQNTDSNAPNTINLTFFSGGLGQEAWSYLTQSFPGAAIGYSEVAYVASSGLYLGYTPILPQYNFEIAGPYSFGAGIPDANPADAIYGLLTGAAYKLFFPALNISPTLLGTYTVTGNASANFTSGELVEQSTTGAFALLIGGPASGTNQTMTMAEIQGPANGTNVWTGQTSGAVFTPASPPASSSARASWSANDFFISAILDSQSSLMNVVNQWCEAGQVFMTFDEGLLKFISLCDSTTIGNGAVYSPATQPIIDLDDNDFVTENGKAPITVSQTPLLSRWNRVQIRWDVRTNDYNEDIYQVQDEASIQQWGLQSESAQDFGFITTELAVQYAGNMRLQRYSAIYTKYAFTAKSNLAFLSPGDIITITDGVLGTAGTMFGRTPCRIVKMTDDPKKGIIIEAENFPWSVGTAELGNIQAQLPSNTNDGPQQDPGNTVPIIFEVPNQAQQYTGGTIYIFANGSNSNWGGFMLYVSYNGVDYNWYGQYSLPGRIGITVNELPGGTAGSSIALPTTTTLLQLTEHNTSANSTYNETNYPANFTGTTWINTSGGTMSVTSSEMDDSLNPITPCHVSPVSIKTLIPNFHGKFSVHLTPWFHSGGGGGHVNIGVDSDSTAWVSAMMNDVKARGFDNVIIDWYGQSDYTNSVTLLIQSFLASNASFGLTYTIMIDTGAYSSTSTLQTQASYVQTQYLSDTNYLTQGGHPVLMFWGPGVGGVNYTTVRSTMGISMYWMFQGPSALSNSWVDACYDWVQPYSTGVVGGDPYNSTDTLAYYSAVNGNAKGAMQCISPGFNGYLTGTTAWSKGKYMPRDWGKCWLSQAATVNTNLCSNAVGIQIVTWCDWEEGSEIESAIDNNITVTSSISGTTLSWSVSGGTGDETTISSYQLIAMPDGTNVGIIGTQATGGSKTFNLSSITTWGGLVYSIYVIAIGKPSIRNQISNAATYNSPGGGGGLVVPYKQLELDNTDTLDVNMQQSGATLQSVTAADMNALVTLSAIVSPGQTFEETNVAQTGTIVGTSTGGGATSGSSGPFLTTAVIQLTSGSGAVAWTNLSNFGSNSAYADATLVDSGTPAFPYNALCSGMNLNVPPGSGAIIGLVASITAYYSGFPIGATGSGQLQLLYMGSVVGIASFLWNGPSVPTSSTTFTVGSLTSLTAWGLPAGFLTQAIVNDPSFGIIFAADFAKAGGGTTTLYANNVTMSVSWAAGGAGTGWVDPNNVSSSSSYASASLATSSITQYLVGSNFNFNLPFGFILDGIEVIVNAYVSTGSATLSATLYADNLLVGGPQSQTITSTPTDIIFGGPALLWAAQNYEDLDTLNSAGFGVGLQAFGTSSTTIYANNVRMTLYGTSTSNLELIAYEFATLTGQNTYALTNILRGVYGSYPCDHPIGSIFARMDEATIIYQIPPTYTGSTIYFKFLSFNAYGNQLQQLSAVTAYELPVGGLAPGAIDGDTGALVTGIGVVSNISGNVTSKSVQWTVGQIAAVTAAAHGTFGIQNIPAGYSWQVPATGSTATPQWLPLITGGGGSGTVVNLYVIPISGSYTAAAWDALICTTTSTAFPVTLPLAASSVNVGIVVIKKTSDANAVTITPSGGDTIQGQATLVLANGGDAVYLISDGISNWQIASGWMAPANDVYIYIPPVAGTYTSSQEIYYSIPVRSFTLPASLTGTHAGCRTAPTGNIQFTIEKNGASVGTINIAASSTTATFTFASAVTFNGTSDTMSIIGPSPADSTLAGFWVDFLATRSL